MSREEIKVYEKYKKLVGYGDKFISVLKYRSKYVERIYCVSILNIVYK